MFLSYDFLVATRANYDLLALAGNIGGFKVVLGWLAILLVSGYSKANGTRILTKNLFQA
jgi:hypothetical protein